jgi:Ca2+-binding EF-hand superfamily protein
VAILIEKNGINLFSRLSAEDRNEGGCIGTDDLRIAFTKLKLNLNTNDIETMMNYFGFQNSKKINIEEFTKNFMAHLNENVEL